MTFDVVTVPDFVAQPELFELRSLLFLGSWRRNAGSEFPLHLACIGEPPGRVRALAEQCHARISVFPAVNAEQSGFSNKLRGLEVESATGRILLLDTDIFVLHPLTSLNAVASDLAACPETIRHLRHDYWKRIFEAKGMSLPTERMASVVGELLDEESAATLSERDRRRLLRMLPYSNGGVVLTSEPLRLRALWEDNIRMIASLFQPTDRSWKSVGASDQAGLAVAVHELREAGVSFELLGAGANTRWPHVATGAVTWDTTLLYHAFGLFRPFPGWKREELFNALQDYALTLTENNPLTRGRPNYRGIQLNPTAAHQFVSNLVPEIQSIIEDYVLA